MYFFFAKIKTESKLLTKVQLINKLFICRYSADGPQIKSTRRTLDLNSENWTLLLKRDDGTHTLLTLRKHKQVVAVMLIASGVN
jgi:hypothetical protein